MSTSAPPRGHDVLFHRNDSDFAGHVASFLRPITTGKPAIVLATREHQAAIAGRLALDGLDVPTLRGQGLLMLIDADEVASALMDGDALDVARFDQLVLNTVTETITRHGTPRIYGELVNVYANRGRPDLSLAIEQLWHGYARIADFHLLCGYDWDRYVEAPEWGKQVQDLHGGHLGDDPQDEVNRAA